MQRLFCVLALMALGVFVVAGSGCAARPAGGGGGGGTNTNDNNTNVNDNNVNDNNVNDNNVNDNNVNDNNVNDNEAPALVKTQISLGYLSGTLHRIEAGDDLVVYAVPDNVRYFVPSTYDDTITEGTEIPGAGTLYETSSWKVAGKKVALTTGSGRVAIYDTVAGGNPVEVPGGEVTLASLPVEPYEPGHMASAGTYFAVICDPNEVDDGNAVKVIDVGGSTAQVISFPTPADALDTPEQVAIDADPARVAALWGNFIYVWDIMDPTADPLAFEFNLGSPLGDIFDNVQIAFDDDYIIYRADIGDGVTALLNVTDSSITNLGNEGPFSINTPVALAAGSFGYFAVEEDVDQISTGGAVYRSSIGTVANPSALSAPDRLADPIDVERDDCIATPGKYGYGSSIAITPDGERWFIAGTIAVDRDVEFLQMSTGGDFMLFEETETPAEGRSQTGYVMGSDVSTSANTVAFWTLRQYQEGSGCITDDDWAVGFIVLDRLED